MTYKRGSRTFDRIVKDDDVTTGVKRDTKGRNRELVKARNLCLLHRYYYYAKLLHLRYDVVLSELKNDFFLSPCTIPRIIDDEVAVIKDMGAKKLTAKKLAVMYPQFSWKQKPQELKVKMPQREVYDRY